MLAILVPIFIVMLSQPLSAEVYRWVDDQGHVHFGDKPPDKQRARSIEISPAPPAAQTVPDSQARRDKQQRLLRAWEEERRQREEKAAERKEQQEQRERNCHIAKDRLRSFRNASALYDHDKDGKRRILKDAEHKAAINDAEEAVNRWCG